MGEALNAFVCNQPAELAKIKEKTEQD